MHSLTGGTNKTRQTPLRLLIKQFPDLAQQVFDKCMETNLQVEPLTQYLSVYLFFKNHSFGLRTIHTLILDYLHKANRILC